MNKTVLAILIICALVGTIAAFGYGRGYGYRPARYYGHRSYGYPSYGYAHRPYYGRSYGYRGYGGYGGYGGYPYRYRYGY